MSNGTNLRFVCVSVFTGDPGSNPSIEKTQFYDTSCSTLIKARDMLIKRERAQYVKDKDYGDEPVGDLIYKFSSHLRNKLVGFHQFDNGLTFLFEEDHPVYKLILSGKCANTVLAEKLIDLWQFYSDHCTKSSNAYA